MTANEKRQDCQVAAAGETAERSDVNTATTQHKPSFPGLLHVDFWLARIVEELAR